MMSHTGMENMLEKLRVRMVGKTIAKIEPPNAPEAVCKFTMTDGTCFRLHATDLGFWVEDTVTEGQHYTSLDSLFIDYYAYNYGLGIQKPLVYIDDQFLTLVGYEGKSFKLLLKGLPEGQDQIIISVKNNPECLDIFAEASTMGDLWRVVQRWDDFPPSLKDIFSK